MEEKVTPPEVSPEVKDTPPKDTEKSAEEIKKEYDDKIALLEKQLKDKDTFIGKQSTEIGELRKTTEKPEEINEEKIEEEVAEVAKDLEKDGMSKEDAIYNAKILVGFDKKRMGKRVMNETIDLIDEDLDEGKIDRKLFEENQTEIMAEFRERKLAPTARKNLKIFRKCFNDVIKRKADKLREDEKKKSEEKRDGLIDETLQPDKGKREEIIKANDQKQRDAIKNAGVKRDSAFF